MRGFVNPSGKDKQSEVPLASQGIMASLHRSYLKEVALAQVVFFEEAAIAILADSAFANQQGSPDLQSTQVLPQMRGPSSVA